MSIEQNYTLRIAITNHCNFKCVYCPEHMEVFEPNFAGNKEHLSDDQLVNIVKLAAKEGISKVSLTGGEPLLKKNIGDFCKCLKTDCGIKRIEMTTNGFLLDHFLDDANSKYVDFFKISFDSFYKQTFNKLVGLDAYDRVLKNIKKLLLLDKPVVLNVVISKENIFELDNLISFAESIGVDLSLLDSVCHLSNKDRRRKNFYDFSNLRDILNKKYPLIGENLASPIVRNKLERIWAKKSTGVSFPYYDTGKIYIRLKDSKTATRRDSICKKCTHFCQEGLCMLRLTLNGRITDCQSIGTQNGFWIQNYPQIQQKKIIEFLQKRFENSFRDEESFRHFMIQNNCME